MKRGRKKTIWTPEMDFIVSNNSAREAAKQLNLSVPTVSTRRRALGVPKGKRVGDGRESYYEEAIARHENGESFTEIANRFGVKRQRIHQVFKDHDEMVA